MFLKRPLATFSSLFFKAVKWICSFLGIIINGYFNLLLFLAIPSESAKKNSSVSTESTLDTDNITNDSQFYTTTDIEVDTSKVDQFFMTETVSDNEAEQISDVNQSRHSSSVENKKRTKSARKSARKSASRSSKKSEDTEKQSKIPINPESSTSPSPDHCVPDENIISQCPSAISRTPTAVGFHKAKTKEKDLADNELSGEMQNMSLVKCISPIELCGRLITQHYDICYHIYIIILLLEIII